MEQTVLVLPAVGEVAATRPKQEAGLSIVSWDGFLDRLDMDLYAAILVGNRLTGLAKQITIAIASEIGGGDPELVGFLARLELEQLLSPLDILRTFATERMWETNSQRNEWWTGKVCQLDCEQVENSALLALQGRQDEIQQLIWRAEVRTLFPVIEYYRQKYVKQYARLLTPYNDGYEVYDVPNLEIGALRWQLSRRPGIDFGDLSLINDLKNARNALAHLRVVDPAIVMRLCVSTPSTTRSMKVPHRL